MVKYHMNRRDRKIKDESEPTNCEALKKYNSNIYKKITDGFFVWLLLTSHDKFKALKTNNEGGIFIYKLVYLP